jgi:hypothetical protein
MFHGIILVKMPREIETEKIDEQTKELAAFGWSNLLRNLRLRKR